MVIAKVVSSKAVITATPRWRRTVFIGGGGIDFICFISFIRFICPPARTP